MSNECHFDLVDQDGNPLSGATAPAVPRMGDKVYFKGTFPDDFVSGYGTVTEVVWQVFLSGEVTPTAHAFVTLRIGKSWAKRISDRVAHLFRLRQERARSQHEYEDAHAR